MTAIVLPGWEFVDNGDGTFSPRRITANSEHPAAVAVAILGDDRLRELTEQCLAEMARRRWAPKTDKAKARAARNLARRNKVRKT